MLEQTELLELTEQGTRLVLKIFRLKEDATGEEVLRFALQCLVVLCSGLQCFECFALPFKFVLLGSALFVLLCNAVR